MAVSEILVGWGLATVSGALGSYFTWVRGRNDASRDAIRNAYADWMAAWSDLVSLGQSSVLTVGDVRAVDHQVLQPVLSAVSRAMRVCLVTCQQQPMAVIGVMYVLATQQIVPALESGTSRDEWERLTAKTTAFELDLVQSVQNS